MRKKYSLWQKIKRRKQPHLTPEEALSPRDRLLIMQIVLVVAVIFLNLAIVLGINLL